MAFSLSSALELDLRPSQLDKAGSSNYNVITTQGEFEEVLSCRMQ
jgi:hypothetical protein